MKRARLDVQSVCANLQIANRDIQLIIDRYVGYPVACISVNVLCREDVNGLARKYLVDAIMETPGRWEEETPLFGHQVDEGGEWIHAVYNDVDPWRGIADAQCKIKGSFTEWSEKFIISVLVTLDKLSVGERPWREYRFSLGEVVYSRHCEHIGERIFGNVYTSTSHLEGMLNWR